MSSLYKSAGIVFRSTKYGESSLILEVLTREKGLRSFIVSGVRKAKSKSSAAIYQHLNILDIVAYDKADKLARIKECKIGYYYEQLPFDIKRSTIGLFILEICKNSIKEREVNEELFDFIRRRLSLLDTADVQYLGLFPIKFLIELCQHIGFQPSDNFSESNKIFDLHNGKFISNTDAKYHSSLEVSEVIANVNRYSLEKCKEYNYTRALRNQVIDDLIIYYRLHIENFQELKTLPVLRSIF